MNCITWIVPTFFPVMLSFTVINHCPSMAAISIRCVFDFGSALWSVEGRWVPYVLYGDYCFNSEYFVDYCLIGKMIM